MGRTLKLMAPLTLAALLFAGPALATGNAANGADLFKRCMACHTFGSGAANRIGPNLFGVVGRTSGTLPGYNYSPAMKRAGLVWSEAMLASYLLAPSKLVPGTKMPFGGFTQPQQAADVAAYLATLK